MVHMWQKRGVACTYTVYMFSCIRNTCRFVGQQLVVRDVRIWLRVSPSFISLQPFTSGLIANLKVMIYRSGSPHGAHTQTHTHVHAYTHA